MKQFLISKCNGRYFLPLFLLSTVTEWVSKTCTLLSQLFELYLLWVGQSTMMNPQQTVNRLSIFLLNKIAVKTSENLVTYQLTFAQLKLSSLCQLSPWVLISSSGSVAGLRRKPLFANDVPTSPWGPPHVTAGQGRGGGARLCVLVTVYVCSVPVPIGG